MVHLLSLKNNKIIKKNPDKIKNVNRNRNEWDGIAIE